MIAPKPQPRRRRRTALAVLAGVVPLAPIAVALSLGTGGAASANQSSPALFKPLSSTPAAPRNLLIPPGNGALVALLQHSTQIRSSPAGRPLARLGLRTSFGSANAMWVVRLQGPWLGVVSPLAGNGHVGWIPAADASLSRVDWELKVSVSARRLTVLDNGRPVQRYAIAVGAPDAPTPTGRFAVTDRLNTGDPAGPYGCCVLALSAKAPHAIQGWTGGNRIAIHSTPETSTIGHPVSHGCMRLTLAEGRWLLNHIPLGTPTVISS